MSWLSRSPSPAHSPRVPPPQASAAMSSSTATAPVTYIPPLIDGACGTVPRAQQPVLATLQTEAKTLFWLLPEFALAALEVTASRWRSLSWRDAADFALQLAIASVEAWILVLATPLWLFLPGVFLLCWVPGAVALVWGLCWMLNPQQPVVRQPAPGAASEGSWMMGQEGEDERWFFVGGMGMSARSTTTSTLPQLAKLFNRPITAILDPTYGLVVDLLLLMAGRALPFLTLPSRTTRLLYGQLRAAMQDASVSRVIVLAHNRGAVPVSRVVSRLCADLPHDKLAKLEVYTFGAAADEFIIPLGDDKMMPEPVHAGGVQGSLVNGTSAAAPGATTTTNGTTTAAGAGTQSDSGGRNLPAATEYVGRRGGPHIEHFAHARDPFARMGVLRSVREDLEGRFCGGVFVINSLGAKNLHRQPSAYGMSMMMRQNGSPTTPGAGTRNSQQYLQQGGGMSMHHRDSSGGNRDRDGRSSPLFPPGGYMGNGINGNSGPYGSVNGAGPGDEKPPAMAATASTPAATAMAMVTGLMSRMPLSGMLPSGLPLPSAPPVVGLEDYLATLFPEQVPTLANCDRASVLDSIMTIDREVAYKREFAAMASHASSTTRAAAFRAAAASTSPNTISTSNNKLAGTGLGLNGTTTSNAGKRLSWTGLGATADGANMDGVMGLEIARKGCKECEGHKPREVSRLVRYVSFGVPVGMHSGFGMDGKDVTEGNVRM